MDPSSYIFSRSFKGLSFHPRMPIRSPVLIWPLFLQGLVPFCWALAKLQHEVPASWSHAFLREVRRQHPGNRMAQVAKAVPPPPEEGTLGHRAGEEDTGGGTDPLDLTDSATGSSRSRVSEARPLHQTWPGLGEGEELDDDEELDVKEETRQYVERYAPGWERSRSRLRNEDAQLEGELDQVWTRQTWHSRTLFRIMYPQEL